MVRMVWITPEADQIVGYCARVSNPDNQDNTATVPKLLGYLIRHKHWSPFEMAHACLEITTDRATARHLLRHSSFRFQEFSQRYADVSALPQPPLREARMQDDNNRQNSLPVPNDPRGRMLKKWWEEEQGFLVKSALALYRAAIRAGIAKEQARAVLPEGLTPTRLYMVGSIRSWLHFYEVRGGNGTQSETTRIANACYDAIREACPVICEAWEANE